MLNKRRELVLRELGLLPLWVLRGRMRTAQSTAVTEARNTPSASNISVHGDDTRNDQILRADWAELKQMVMTCTDCPLHGGRKQSVFGVGDERADWLFIGEGPGAEEDARGEPFVGQAGRLLDNMLSAIGLKRGQDVYIANVVKCRPPGNRT